MPFVFSSSVFGRCFPIISGASTAVIISTSQVLSDPCGELGVLCAGDRLFAGVGADAQISLSNGSLSYSDLIIGFDSNANFEVSGAGNLRTGSMVIGLLSDGSLSLSGGGLAVVDSGEGNIFLGTGAGVQPASGAIYIGAGRGENAAAPGSLLASQILLGPGGGEITFNHNAQNYTFDIDVLGQSGVIRVESGLTRPTGDFSEFFGDLIVGSGNRASSAILEVGDVTSAGAAINLGGDFILRRGGAVNITVDPSGAADHLIVGGAVNLDGNLQILPLGTPSDYGAPEAEFRYSIIRYDDQNLVGEFEGIDGGFLQLGEVIYSDSESGEGNSVVVVLRLDRPDLAGDAVGRSEQSVAFAINRFDYSLPGGSSVLRALRSLSEEDRAAAFRQIGGMDHEEIFQSPGSLSGSFVETLFNRMSQTPAQPIRGNLTVSTSNLRTQFGFPVENIWGRAFVGSSSREPRQDNPGFATRVAGSLFGADLNFREGLNTGVAVGISETNSTAGTVNATAQGYHLGLYGAAGASSPFDLGVGFRGAIFASFFDFSTVRSISFGGLSGSAEAHFSGLDAGIEAIIRHGVSSGAHDAVIAPFAGLRYSQFASEGYSESGAQSLNLEASSYRSEQLTSIIGVEYSQIVGAPFGEIRQMLSMSWERNLASSSESRTFRLQGSNAPMTFSTPQYDADRLGLVGSLAVDLSRHSSVELSLAGFAADRADSFSGGITYRLEF